MYILATSLLGSYTSIRGLAFIVGNYPNEFQLASEFKIKNFNSVFIKFIKNKIFIFLLFKKRFQWNLMFIW